MAELETLHCVLGDHDWERERKRGKKPQNCPTHKPVASEADLEERERLREERRIAAAVERNRATILAHAAEAKQRGCKCKYDPDASWIELVRMGSGCTGSDGSIGSGGGWVCPELDRLRRDMNG